MTSSLIGADVSWWLEETSDRMKINNYLRHSPKAVFAGIIALALITVSFNAYSNWWSSPATDSVDTPPVTAPLTSNEDATERKFVLEDWVKRDPENFIVYNKLAAYSFNACARLATAYLDLTSRAARASLPVIPAQRILAH